MAIEKEKIIELVGDNKDVASALGEVFETYEKTEIEKESLKTANEQLKKKLENNSIFLNTLKDNLKSVGYDGESDIKDFFQKIRQPEKKEDPEDPTQDKKQTAKTKIPDELIIEMRSKNELLKNELTNYRTQFEKLKQELDNAKAEKEFQKNYKDFRRLFQDEDGEDDYVLLDEVLPKYAKKLGRDSNGNLILPSKTGEEMLNKSALDYANEVKAILAPAKKSKQKKGTSAQPFSKMDIKQGENSITEDYIQQRRAVINRNRNKSGL